MTVESSLPLRRRRGVGDRYIHSPASISKYRISSPRRSLPRKKSRSSSRKKSIPSQSKVSSQLATYQSVVAASLDLAGLDQILGVANNNGHRSSTPLPSLNESPLRALEFCYSLIERPDLDHSFLLGMPVDRETLKSENRVDELTSEKILDAPELLNDYYSSLIAWSGYKNVLAVALQKSVYLWSAQTGPKFIGLPNFASLITTLSFSEKRFLAIGRQDQTLIIYDISTNETILTHSLCDRVVTCMAWKPSSDSELFIGDQHGSITNFRISKLMTYADDKDTGHEYTLSEVYSFRGHSQQICGLFLLNLTYTVEKLTLAGIAFSPTLDQIAVGGNDNLVTLWDTRKMKAPRLRFRMPHNAAVKALAFCPWLPHLLATGGGTNDRNLRFWHTKSGTLIECHDVEHQVTAVIWSLQKRQLVATFGFGDPDNHLMFGLFSFPGCKLLKKCRAKYSSSRVLSVAISPDSSTICLASSDQTLQFFQIWGTGNTVPSGNSQKTSNTSQLTIHDRRGLFGSEIIDMLEGHESDNIVR